MGELLMLFITGGGSTAMGAILKGVFGYVFEARQQKHDLEMAREARNNDNFLRLQAQINQGGNSEFVSFTRRILAVLGLFTMSAVTILCCLWPEAPIVTCTGTVDGTGTNEILFGLFSWTSKSEEITVSSGHIALVTTTVVYPAIIGFYFGPSGRR